ncbi:MAG: hypothetical protein ACREO5_10585 [Candidatus Binatia bacterium]
MELSEDTLPLGSTHIVVLYDPCSGQIAHRHDQMTLKDTAAPDKKVLEKEALEIASRYHPNAAQLAILHTESLHPERLYRVDVQKRVLVEMPPHEHRRGNWK